MARHLELTVEADHTEEILAALRGSPGVVGVVLQRGGSVVPPGDLLRVIATNAGAREVLRLVDHRHPDRSSAGDETTRGVSSIAVSEPLSVKAAGHHEELLREASEATLNDIEGQLRRESNPGFNFYVLMALAGGLAAVGMVTGTVYIVLGSMVLAPGFEPFLRVPFALIAGARGSVGRGLAGLVSGYATLAVGAALTLVVLRSLGYDTPLAELGLVGHWANVDRLTLVVAALGGLGGAITVTAGRPEFTIGVMIALGLIPTAALAGMAASTAEWSLAGEGLTRWATDGLAVSVAAVLVIGAKALLLHHRRTQE